MMAVAVFRERGRGRRIREGKLRGGKMDVG